MHRPAVQTNELKPVVRVRLRKSITVINLSVFNEVVRYRAGAAVIARRCFESPTRIRSKRNRAGKPAVYLRRIFTLIVLQRVARDAAR